MGEQKRADTRDMRRGHGASIDTTIIAVGPIPAGENRAAGRPEVHGRGAVIGEVSQSIGMGRGQNGDDVVQIVTGRINRVDLVAFGGIAAGSDEDDSGLTRAVDGIAQRRGSEGGSTPTGVDHPGPFAPRIIDALDRIADQTIPRRIDELAGHDLRLPTDADTAKTVVAEGANRAADVCPVPVIVVRIARVIDRVNAVHVVHITIAVVVNPVARDLPGIDPNAVGQIFVGVSHARVDYRHEHFRRAVLHLPPLGRVNVGVRHAAVLAEVIQSPQQSLSVGRIGRCHQRPHWQVRLGVLDQTALPKNCQQVLDAFAGRGPDDLQISNGRESVQNRRAQQHVQNGQVQARNGFDKYAAFARTVVVVQDRTRGRNPHPVVSSRKHSSQRVNKVEVSCRGDRIGTQRRPIFQITASFDHEHVAGGASHAKTKLVHSQQYSLTL